LGGASTDESGGTGDEEKHGRGILIVGFWMGRGRFSLAAGEGPALLHDAATSKVGAPGGRAIPFERVLAWAGLWQIIGTAAGSHSHVTDGLWLGRLRSDSLRREIVKWVGPADPTLPFERVLAWAGLWQIIGTAAGSHSHVTEGLWLGRLRSDSLRREIVKWARPAVEPYRG